MRNYKGGNRSGSSSNRKNYQKTQYDEYQRNSYFSVKKSHLVS